MSQHSGYAHYQTPPFNSPRSERDLTLERQALETYQELVLPSSSDFVDSSWSIACFGVLQTPSSATCESLANTAKVPSHGVTHTADAQESPTPPAPRLRLKARLSASPDVTPLLQEDLVRDRFISDSIQEAHQNRAPWKDYLRTIHEMLSIAPGVWAKRLALTALGAICTAVSTFTFSQSVALIGESAALQTVGVTGAVALSVLTYFAACMGFWYASYFLEYKNDVLTARQTNDVDLAIDRSIKELTGALPEEMRQREEVAELCSIVERHQESSKELVGGIIGLSQECVEMLVTSSAMVWSGGGLGIIPIALGGYLKYCNAHRISRRQVESEQLAAELDLLYEDGDRTLSTNSSISILQIAQSHARVVERVMKWKTAAAEIRLDALKKNELDQLITNKILEVPVAGACLYFMSQWISGEISPAWCIWLLMSAWSLRGNINEIGALLSAQVTDLELASHRHTLVDITKTLGDQRNKVVLTEAPSIHFEEVRLRRPGSTRDTLKRTSLDIPAGSCVGILGSNGQGKSSFVALILGRILPTSGNVFVGTHNTRESAILTGALNQDLSLVPGLSVRENIELFRPAGGGMSADDVVELLGITEILFENKPDGLDTIVPGKNQKGTNFSGGQTQLIALARAIAAESRLLVLDEPLSALSPAVQTRIHSALLSLNPRPTLIMVTHKIEQAHGCDSVMIIDRGEIVERGTPEELLQKPNSRFVELYKAQKEMAARKKQP
jgi:ABC-type multidrug transport system fused ATPase/permease subunit